MVRLGFYYRRDGVVVKAHEGNVGGDADAHLFERYYAAHGAIIIGDEDGIREEVSWRE